MSSEAELLDALRRDPSDVATLMVYADALLSRGDSRGELIMLQYRDHTTPGGLTDLDALERFLELSAEHGFLVLPDDPDASVLRFHGGQFPSIGGSAYIDYRVTYAGHEYGVYFSFGDHTFRITVDGVEARGNRAPMGSWTAEETNVTLAILSHAIMTGQPFDELDYPHWPQLRAHPHYGIGRCPLYALPEEFTATRPHTREWAIDNRDRSRWYSLWRRLQALRRKR